MKTKRYLVQGFLLLLCSMTALAGSPSEEPQHPQNPQKQTGKRPRIQTSASKKEIVFKPNAETGKAETGKAGKGKAGTEKTKAVKVAGKKPKGAATGKQVKKKPQQKTASERYMALKTNIAYDAIAVPNLVFEMQFSKHISVELPVMFSGWDISDKHAVRTFAVQPEGRWWLEKAGKGHFFGVHAHMALFNVKWDENRYQSTGRPLLGAGVSYGYKLPFSRHWGAEFTLGAGYANMKYNTYYNIDNGALIETKSRNYWGITRLGISLSYHF